MRPRDTLRSDRNSGQEGLQTERFVNLALQPSSMTSPSPPDHGAQPKVRPGEVEIERAGDEKPHLLGRRRHQPSREHAHRIVAQSLDYGPELLNLRRAGFSFSAILLKVAVPIYG